MKENEYPLLNITEISWDTDGETIDDLPTEVKIEWDCNEWNEEEVGDWLSDECGWLVNGFCVEEINNKIEGNKIMNNELSINNNNKTEGNNTMSNELNNNNNNKTEGSNTMSKTHLRLSKLNVSWSSLGITIDDFNKHNHPNRDVEEPYIINGKIWCYDEKYCKKGEVVEQSWELMGESQSFDLDSHYDNFGEDYGILYQKYGLFLKDEYPLELEFVSGSEVKELTNNPINVDEFFKGKKYLEENIEGIVVGNLMGLGGMS